MPDRRRVEAEDDDHERPSRQVQGDQAARRRVQLAPGRVQGHGRRSPRPTPTTASTATHTAATAKSTRRRPRPSRTPRPASWPPPPAAPGHGQEGPQEGLIDAIERGQGPTGPRPRSIGSDDEGRDDSKGLPRVVAAFSFRGGLTGQSGLARHHPEDLLPAVLPLGLDRRQPEAELGVDVDLGVGRGRGRPLDRLGCGRRVPAGVGRGRPAASGRWSPASAGRRRASPAASASLAVSARRASISSLSLRTWSNSSRIELGLLAVERGEPLEHHHHGLMKLVEHLLLHQAELVDQEVHRRVDRPRPGSPRTVARSWPLGGISAGRGHRPDGSGRTGRGSVGSTVASAPRPARRSGPSTRGRGRGGESYRARSACRPTRSSSPSSIRAKRTGLVVDEDAVLPEQVDDPDPVGREHQAAMELRDVGLDDPDLAGRRPADQGQVPVHPPDGLADRPAWQLPGHAGRRARRLRGRSPGHLGPDRERPDLDRPAPLEPARPLGRVAAVGPGPAPEVDAVDTAPR